MKKILQNNNSTIVKADKSKGIIIIDRNTLGEKTDNFVQDNNIKQINKDPTDKYQRQIQQTIQRCNLLVDKQKYEYLTNIKPMAPKLIIYIKTHKDSEPVRPVINTTQAPSYKIAKHLNKKLYNLLCLPNTYNTKNSQEIAEELKRVQINEQMRIITLDIKDLYVNLPIPGIIRAAKFWLNKNISDKELIKQTLHMLQKKKGQYHSTKHRTHIRNRALFATQHNTACCHNTQLE